MDSSTGNVSSEFAMEMALRLDELAYENAQLRAVTTGFVTADYAAHLEEQIARLRAEVAQLRARIGVDEMIVAEPPVPQVIPMDEEPQTPRVIPMETEPRTPRFAMQIETDPDNESSPDWAMDVEPQTPRFRTMK